MKAVKRLSDDQRRMLVSLETKTPEELGLDNIMSLGGNGLIEFEKEAGFKLTKKERKAVGLLEAC